MFINYAQCKTENGKKIMYFQFGNFSSYFFVKQRS